MYRSYRLNTENHRPSKPGMSSLTSLFLVKVSVVGVIASILSFIKINRRMLRILIRLEALILRLLVILFGCLRLSRINMHFFLLLLTFAACEAALGLSLLVRVLRVRRNDYVYSFSSINFYV